MDVRIVVSSMFGTLRRALHCLKLLLVGKAFGVSDQAIIAVLQVLLTEPALNDLDANGGGVMVL